MFYHVDVASRWVAIDCSFLTGLDDDGAAASQPGLKCDRDVRYHLGTPVHHAAVDGQQRGHSTAAEKTRHDRALNKARMSKSITAKRATWPAERRMTLLSIRRERRHLANFKALEAAASNLD